MSFFFVNHDFNFDAFLQLRILFFGDGVDENDCYLCLIHINHQSILILPLAAYTEYAV